jgi:hypothetical protein
MSDPEDIARLAKAARARLAAKDARPGAVKAPAGGPPAWIQERIARLQKKNAILRELGILKEED